MREFQFDLLRHTVEWVFLQADKWTIFAEISSSSPGKSLKAEKAWDRTLFLLIL